MARDWGRTGEQAIGAAADLGQGLFNGLKSIGGRFKRGKHEPFINAFCAVAGDVISQNGAMKDEEVKAFKDFLFANRSNNAFAMFEPDDIIQRMKGFAMASFTQDKGKILDAITGIDAGSDSAKMVVIAALSVAFADGDCDNAEATCIAQHAGELGINIPALAQEFQIPMPPQLSGVNTGGISVPHQVVHAPAQPESSQTVVPSVNNNVQNNSAHQTTVNPVTQPVGNPCPMCNGQQPKMSSCAFCKSTGVKK